MAGGGSGTDALLDNSVVPLGFGNMGLGLTEIQGEAITIVL